MEKIVTGQDGITRIKVERAKKIIKTANALTLRVENEAGGPTSLVNGIDAVRGITRFVQIGHNQMTGRPLDSNL